MTDGHYPTYREMLEKVDWDAYGVVDGVARDSRCENCMVHCGYDPSGAAGHRSPPRGHLEADQVHLGPRPRPFRREPGWTPSTATRQARGTSPGRIPPPLPC